MPDSRSAELAVYGAPSAVQTRRMSQRQYSGPRSFRVPRPHVTRLTPALSLRRDHRQRKTSVAIHCERVAAGVRWLGTELTPVARRGLSHLYHWHRHVPSHSSLRCTETVERSFQLPYVRTPYTISMLGMTADPYHTAHSRRAFRLRHVRTCACMARPRRCQRGRRRRRIDARVKDSPTRGERVTGARSRRVYLHSERPRSRRDSFCTHPLSGLMKLASAPPDRMIACPR